MMSKRIWAIIAAVLIVSLSLMGGAVAEEQEVIAYADVSADSVLRVHIGKSISSDVFFYLERSEQVTVEELDGEWARVSRGGDWGWCVASYLSSTDPNETDGYYIVVSDGRVRVRKKPNGDRVKYINDGDRVYVDAIKEVDGVLWAYIGDGYVMMEFLNKEEQ